MRKLLLLASFLLSNCLVLPSSAQTVNAVYNFANFTTRPLNVRSLTLTPIAPVGGVVWPGSQIPGTLLKPTPLSFSVAQYPQMTNGTFTVTNLLTGYPYAVAVADSWSVQGYTNFFGTNESGAVDASTNLVIVLGSMVITPVTININGGGGGADTNYVLSVSNNLRMQILGSTGAVSSAAIVGTTFDLTNAAKNATNTISAAAVVGTTFDLTNAALNATNPIAGWVQTSGTGATNFTLTTSNNLRMQILGSTGAVSSAAIVGTTFDLTNAAKNATNTISAAAVVGTTFDLTNAAKNATNNFSMASLVGTTFDLTNAAKNATNNLPPSSFLGLTNKPIVAINNGLGLLTAESGTQTNIFTNSINFGGFIVGSDLDSNFIIGQTNNFISKDGNQGNQSRRNTILNSENSTIDNYYSGIQDSVIAGGVGNLIGSSTSFIGAGRNNSINDQDDASAIMAGSYNFVDDTDSLIGAGTSNSILAGASEGNDVIDGGALNSMTPAIGYNLIAGGFNNNITGDYSFAGGTHSTVHNTGSFVWSDSIGGGTSTADNQVVFAAHNGFYLPFGQFNGNGSGLTFNNLQVTNNFSIGGNTNFITVKTNTLGFDGSGIGGARGTYRWIAAGTWTNAIIPASPFWGIASSAGAEFVQSNGISWYSFTLVAGVPSAVTTLLGPGTARVWVGAENSRLGIYDIDPTLNTNLTAQTLTLIAGSTNVISAGVIVGTVFDLTNAAKNATNAFAMVNLVGTTFDLTNAAKNATNNFATISLVGTTFDLTNAAKNATNNFQTVSLVGTTFDLTNAAKNATNNFAMVNLVGTSFDLTNAAKNATNTISAAAVIGTTFDLTNAALNATNPISGWVKTIGTASTNFTMTASNSLMLQILGSTGAVSSVAIVGTTFDLTNAARNATNTISAAALVGTTFDLTNAALNATNPIAGWVQTSGTGSTNFTMSASNVLAAAILANTGTNVTFGNVLTNILQGTNPIAPMYSGVTAIQVGMLNMQSFGDAFANGQYLQIDALNWTNFQSTFFVSNSQSQWGIYSNANALKYITTTGTNYAFYSAVWIPFSDLSPAGQSPIGDKMDFYTMGIMPTNFPWIGLSVASRTYISNIVLNLGGGETNGLAAVAYVDSASNALNVKIIASTNVLSAPVLAGQVPLASLQNALTNNNAMVVTLNGGLLVSGATVFTNNTPIGFQITNMAGLKSVLFLSNNSVTLPGALTNGGIFTNVGDVNIGGNVTIAGGNLTMTGGSPGINTGGTINFGNVNLGGSIVGTADNARNVGSAANRMATVFTVNIAGAFSSIPTNAAIYNSPITTVLIGTKWTNTFSARSGLDIYLVYNDAVTGAASFNFQRGTITSGTTTTTNVNISLTPLAGITLSAFSKTNDTPFVIQCLGTNEWVLFTDTSGTGATVTIATNQLHLQ